MKIPPAANQPYRLPPRLFDARCKACWCVAAIAVLIIASFASLPLRWSDFFSAEAVNSMGRFLREFFPPETDPTFLSKTAWAALETLAMSALGTLLAALGALVLALPASRQRAISGAPVSHGVAVWWNRVLRLVLNALRSIPELVWAALLLISAGLGPFAGTLALALHTMGVLGRLFVEAVENAPLGPAQALRTQGVGRVAVYAYATLPQVLPQLMSYTLYRWENNIRAAAVLGVVGAGGLGQLLSFHMGLFHMQKTATILLAMLAMVALVDAASHVARTRMQR
jgi:phosphonate transport system permease protein